MHLPEHPLVSEMDPVMSKWQSEYLPIIEMVTEEGRPGLIVSRILYKKIAYHHLQSTP